MYKLWIIIIWKYFIQISFDNVAIPQVPKEAFLKPLASIMFYNCHIGDLHTDALKAAEISSVIISNTTLNHIQEGAFTDRTLIMDLKIVKCKISKIKTRAIMAATGNFSITHSRWVKMLQNLFYIYYIILKKFTYI